MEITRKLLYHATTVKNVQLEESDISNHSKVFLSELNTEDGQYHSISLSKEAAAQLLQQLSQAMDNS